jgi:hypothetical protein
VTQVEAGFARLTHNIPVDPEDPDYAGATRELVDKVVNSDNLGCYLTVLETGAAALRVVLVHSIGKYSAGFGAFSTLNGVIMGFMGEMIGDSLPVLVPAPIDKAD